jgi:TonB family protein
VTRILCLLCGGVIAANAADVNGFLGTARSARSAHNFTEAASAYDSAFELTISKQMNRLSPVAVEVATFFLQQQQPERAEAVLKRALDAEDAARQAPVIEIPVLIQLRGVYQARRNGDLATVETRLVKAWERLAGPESVVVANNLYYLGGTLEQTGQLAEAEQAIQRAIAILQKTYGGNTPAIGLAFGRLASIETKLGKDDPAREARSLEAAVRQKPSGEAPFKAGGGVTAPRLISNPNPAYSEKARRAKIQGTVMISLIVDSIGEPVDVTVVLPLGEGLDESAKETVKTWRFQPGTKEGQPVRVQATIEVNFRLL